MEIYLDDKDLVPTRAHETDAGLDLRAAQRVTVPARSRVVIPTGVYITHMDDGTYCQIASKSGLAAKHGLIAAGGVIDPTYTGEVKVIIINTDDKRYTFHKYDKVAQLIMVNITIPEIDVVTTIPETDRGANGFGSTGAR